MTPRRPSISEMSNSLNDILSAEPYAPPLGRAVLVAAFFVTAAAGYIASAGLWTGLTGGSPGSTRETLAPPAPPAPAAPAPTTPAQPQPQQQPPRGIDLDAPIAPPPNTSEPKPLPRRSL